MTVKSNNRIKPEILTSTRRSAWQHILSVYLKMTYWETLLGTTINPTEWGRKLAKDRLELVTIEQVSLIFGRLFRSILKKIYSENTSKNDGMYVFVTKVSLIANR